MSLYTGNNKFKNNGNVNTSLVKFLKVIFLNIINRNNHINFMKNLLCNFHRILYASLTP